MKPCPAIQTLGELKKLRLSMRAPKHGLFVTTEPSWTALFRDLGFMTAEVWPRDLDALAWPIRGLRVFAVVSWKDYVQRLKLFEQLMAAEPYLLDWHAIEQGTGRTMGKVIVDRGGVSRGTV